ncbi:MAG: hypothetical protein GWN99_18100, partial [Gemmatimonadetes bacterium]|nr:hypothetical protein [Gemmatimonadota bacterium]NIS02948.1 hypothetical protein [Gemmatimonadota bacterium]NIT67733.1 hypothetical protein [Gemmatimonadota bacterium]NIU51633.1 hypothetical protein [Gemmatimonadota bacterium]NIV25347.1 hypothetical protein [Gemmatimonadota bacterium]
DGYAPNRRSDAFGPVIRITNDDDNYLWALSFELRRRFADRAGILASYSYTRSADSQSLIS